MRLKHLEINGFKSFAKKTTLEFQNSIVSIVGPNGSGKSNVVEAFRFVLGEQSMKSMRGKGGIDMIFKGSKNLPKGSRASVTIDLDNSDKVFKLTNENGEYVPINFDTISISREVYPDGVNKYILNNREVRLRDIHQLVSSVNIGISGHHIISQGEADRILNSSPKDLREIIQGALGLEVYQYRIKESVRKLERTDSNIKEVMMLRRENAPHLNFLRKQVEKFEKVKELKDELFNLYQEYFKKETFYIENEKDILLKEKNKLTDEFNILLSQIHEEDVSVSENANLDVLNNLENKINEIRRIKNEIERKLGRIEGMIEMEENREQVIPKKMISQGEIESFVLDVDKYIDEAINKEDINEIRNILISIKNILNKFSTNEMIDNQNTINNQLVYLQNTQKEILEQIQNIENEEKDLLAQISELKNKINLELEEIRTKERAKFDLKVRQQELSSILNLNRIKYENLNKNVDILQREKEEAVMLLNNRVLYTDDLNIEMNFDRNTQEDLHRKIERNKIKLEDSGILGASDIIKEYNEVKERDEFLAKEVEDLQKSIESLQQIIKDLKERVGLEFKDGVKKINKEFQEFFALMFGGGNASLGLVVYNTKKRIEDTDEEGENNKSNDKENELIFEEGIEINISLPHKKVKELHSLSGGERSLTSIALLFAMSQVNPPPFLILDETDAALDEANSRKYGDMLERLSYHSQLIVVTHNRETMSRAGVLYGVTIGSDGASKLLSVRFEEAQAIAK
ncbi:MAG: AAA family ATPase [bacterium]|nr:AAA family ATPase [bacterium]